MAIEPTIGRITLQASAAYLLDKAGFQNEKRLRRSVDFFRTYLERANNTSLGRFAFHDNRQPTQLQNSSAGALQIELGLFRRVIANSSFPFSARILCFSDNAKRELAEIIIGTSEVARIRAGIIKGFPKEDWYSLTIVPEVCCLVESHPRFQEIQSEMALPLKRLNVNLKGVIFLFDQGLERLANQAGQGRINLVGNSLKLLPTPIPLS